MPHPYTRQCDRFRQEGIPYIAIIHSHGSMFCRLGEYKVDRITYNQWGEPVKRKAKVHMKAKPIYKAYKNVLWGSVVYMYLDPLPDEERDEFTTYFGVFCMNNVY